LLGIAGLSLALAFTSGVLFGFFGLSTCAFAGYHGFLFQNRVVKRALAGNAVNRLSDFALLVCSVMLGAAASVAGLVAFAGTCIPATLIAYQAAGIQDWHPGIFVIWVACAGIAIFGVCWLVRWFLPRKPNNT
jgi:hypothetical protein